MKHALIGTYFHRLFGERIFHHEIWKPDQRSMAAGLALGLFIAFTPTIPFQMILSIIGAVVLRVNLPIALAACFITNPVTAVPIYLAAHQLGQFLIESTAFESFILGHFKFHHRTGEFMRQSIYLWTGSLIFSSTSAVLGNACVHIIGNFNRRMKRAYDEKKQRQQDQDNEVA
ncbi:DUF2062 domain-containing protein [bacterium]|nr:DUF2062 domain-containing protein [candidate division CSSED10-310 bacterium]